jgi:hypothetical protein
MPTANLSSNNGNMYRELATRDASKNGILPEDFLNLIEIYLQIFAVIILLQLEHASGKSESMPRTIWSTTFHESQL